MTNNQIIEYDPEANILVVRLMDGKIVDEKLLDNDIVLGVNEENEIVYIKVWDASKRGLTKTLVNLARKKRNMVKAIIESTK